LGVVADGHHAVVRGNEVDDLRLERVGVLVFVDEDVAEAAREILGDAGGFFEEEEPVFEEVVVIDDVLIVFFLCVGGGEGGDGVFDFGVLREKFLDGVGDGALGVAREGEEREERRGASDLGKRGLRSASSPRSPSFLRYRGAAARPTPAVLLRNPSPVFLRGVAPVLLCAVFILYVFF
jgi:hypothetical protein